MSVQSISLDDPSDEDLFVFSGSDLLVSHYDVADLDWQEVAERSLLDQRRGLVIAQVAVLEDLVDEFLCYLSDPVDPDAFQSILDRQTLGPRIDQLQRAFERLALLDSGGSEVIENLRHVVDRRNELAHGTLVWQPVGAYKLGDREVTLEWIIESRRDRTRRRITTSQLRSDLYDAIGTFSSMLQFAEFMVEHVPAPKHFRGGRYLGVPTP